MRLQREEAPRAVDEQGAARLAKRGARPADGGLRAALLGGGDELALGLHLQQAEFLLILHLGERRDGQVFACNCAGFDELKVARAVTVEGHAAKRAEHRIEVND